jgi:hypothetical protein
MEPSEGVSREHAENLRMTFSDPLQWVIIGVFTLGILGLVIYLLVRFSRTLTKVDRYLDSKGKGAQ